MTKLDSILEKEMATHYSVLAWRIPGTGEPGELLAMGSHRVGHDWNELVLVLQSILKKQRHYVVNKGPSSQIRSDLSLSHVRLFVTPWIAACHASLSITNFRSMLRFTSIESVMLSSHLIFCRPLLLLPQSLPASESFPRSQLFTWGGQSTGVSALASFLPKKSQGWSPSEWTGWISWQSKGLSRVFSNTIVQKHQFFGAQPSSQSNSHIHTWP